MLSGEQKFGSDSDNYNRYSFEQNVGSYLEGENLDITAKDINISGSTVVGKTAKIDAQNINVSSNVDKIETERRSKTKDFLKSNSKYEFNHSEENIAGNLLIEDKGEIYGDINLVGSNLSLGKNSYIDGKLNTDAKETFNKYIYEEKNKGISSSIGKNGISVSYGKTQYRYDEKDKTHIKSNVYLDDGTVLNKGANITATNFVHGDISINNGDVIYGARKR